MPRDQFVVEHFSAGIVSSPDAQDIPDDAASSSLNLDPEASPGVLRGRRDDDAVSPGATSMRFGGFIERDTGEQDLVYFNGTSIMASRGFPSTPATVEANANVTSILPFSKEFRVGVSSGDVRWVGYAVDDQFDNDGNTDTLVVTNARLDNPSGDPFYDKCVFYSTTAVYCLVRGETSLIKLDLTAGTTTRVGTFINTVAISRGITDATLLWVVDNTGTSTDGAYSLYSIDMDSSDTQSTAKQFDTAYTLPKDASGTLVGGVITDCETIQSSTGGAHDQLLVAFHALNYGGANSEMNKMPYASSSGVYLGSVETNASSPLTLTDRTPRRASATSITTGEYAIKKREVVTNTSTGALVSDTTTYIRHDQFPYGANAPYMRGCGIAQTFPRSLVRLADTRVAWLWRTIPNASYTAPAQIVGENTVVTTYSNNYWYDGSSYIRYQGAILSVVPPDYSTANGWALVDLNFAGGSDINGLGFNTSTRDLAITTSSGPGGWIHRLIMAAGIQTAAAGDDFAYDPTATRGLPLDYTVSDWYTDTSNYWIMLRQEGYTGVDRLLFAFTETTVLEPKLESGTVELVTASAAGSGFQTDHITYYKISFTFDGTQEGPLSATTWKYSSRSSSAENVNVTLRLSPATLSRRASHLNLYRGDSVATGIAADGFYRHVLTVPLTREGFKEQTESAWEAYFFDDNSVNGAAYEARVGVSETLDDTFADYEASTLLNGSLFVIGCRHEELPDANYMVFKSKPYRFDTFNWPDEYLRLPEIPTAISSFAGRLLVFSATGVYRIDPENLIIEDYFPGAGAYGQQSLAQTDDGVYFCDVNGIYLTNATGIAYVGLPIRESLDGTSYAWKKATHTDFTPKVVYSSQLKQVHFITSYNASHDVISFAFHTPTKRWDAWQLTDSAGANSGAITGREGELYWSVTSSMEKVASSADTRLPWEWISRKLTLGAPSQRKRFYDVVVDYLSQEEVGGGVWKYPSIPVVTGNLKVYVQVDDSLAWEQVLDTTGAAPVTALPATTRGTNIQVKATGATAVDSDHIIRSITLLFRRMVGLR